MFVLLIGKRPINVIASGEVSFAESRSVFPDRFIPKGFFIAMIFHPFICQRSLADANRWTWLHSPRSWIWGRHLLAQSKPIKQENGVNTSWRLVKGACLAIHFVRPTHFRSDRTQRRKLTIRTGYLFFTVVVDLG